MKKRNLQWSIKDLQKNIKLIEFPEYQREPTVWGLEKKQKLIDSILRQFDMASIYLYKREDNYYDCIDGRQRINAILSFLGLNKTDESNGSDRLNNGFKFVSSDELLDKKHQKLTKFHNKTWKKIRADKDKTLGDQFLNYVFNVVEIREIEHSDELNLMFLRLQLGAALIPGEKLNAMVGDMRDLIFFQKAKDNLGNHPYFEFLNIPQRRYAKQLTASQIALNFFALREKQPYKRARFVDLQEFFSSHAKLKKEDVEIAKSLRERLNQAYNYLKKTKKLNLSNRAIGITVFFFINKLIDENRQSVIQEFINFLKVFLDKLKEQVQKGINMDREYQELLKFQTYISQAAVEPYAIKNREKLLEEYFNYWLKHKKIKKSR